MSEFSAENVSGQPKGSTLVGHGNASCQAIMMRLWRNGFTGCCLFLPLLHESMSQKNCMICRKTQNPLRTAPDDLTIQGEKGDGAPRQHVVLKAAGSNKGESRRMKSSTWACRSHTVFVQSPLDNFAESPSSKLWQGAYPEQDRPACAHDKPLTSAVRPKPK